MSFVSYNYQWWSESEAPHIRDMRWDSPLPLPALLMQFCLFFHHEFRWGSEVAPGFQGPLKASFWKVSVRMGCRLSITEPCFNWLEKWENRLHIEDPFLLERNLNCVLGSWQEGLFDM